MAQVRVKHGQSATKMSVVDLSRSGVMVDLAKHKRPPWLEIEASVELMVYVKGERDGVPVAGVVVRIVEDRRFRAFAIEFTEYGEKTRSALEDLFARGGIEKAGPPPLPQ